MRTFSKLSIIFVITIVGITVTYANDVTIDDPAPDPTVSIDDPTPDPTVSIDDPTPDPTDSDKPDKRKKRDKSTPTPTPDVTTPAPTFTPTPDVTTPAPTFTPTPDVTTPAPTFTPTPDVTTPAPTNTPIQDDEDDSEYPLKITANKSEVYVGQSEDVRFTVMATYPDSCGPNKEAGQVCAQVLTDFPEPEVHVSLEGVASDSGTTDNDGEVTIVVNANSEGTVTVIASKSGYQDGSTTINAKNKPDTGSNGRSSSSGSSSTGSTLSSMEPFDNIVRHEVRERNLVYNQSVEYTFDSPEFSIYKVIVNGRQNEYDVPVRVESLKDTSRLAKPAPGIVYKNENIWIGSKKINYIIVKFRVKNSWIDHDYPNDSLKPYLLKWNGSTWLVYMSNITGKDDTYTYFESQKAIGIVFAISSPIPKTVNKNESIDVIVQEEIIVPEKEEIEMRVPERLPGFGMLITTIGMILSVIYVVRKR